MDEGGVREVGARSEADTRVAHGEALYSGEVQGQWRVFTERGGDRVSLLAPSLTPLHGEQTGVCELGRAESCGRGPPAPGQWQKGALCSRDGRTSRSGGVRSEDCESLFGLSSCPGCLLRGQVGTSRSQVDNVGMGLREALLGAGTAAVGQ